MRIFLYILLVIALIFAVPLVFMYLWNSIISGVFTAPELTFWQSFGLIILIGMVGSAFGVTKSK